MKVPFSNMLYHMRLQSLRVEESLKAHGALDIPLLQMETPNVIRSITLYRSNVHTEQNIFQRFLNAIYRLKKKQSFSPLPITVYDNGISLNS